MHAVRRLRVAALAGLLGLGLAGTASAAESPLYWGAHLNGGYYGYGAPPKDMRAVDAFESHARKRASILTFGNSWRNNGVWEPFPLEKFENVRRHGSIPFYTWGSRDGAYGADQPDFRTAVIASGRYDDYIRQFATAARDWGHPMFLRLDWEMNGWWYPWGEGRRGDGTIVNGNRPGDYVAMWRHVRDVFDEVGATNVTWVWCVNHTSTSSQYASMSSVYPGDAEVDWTAIDPYNRYPPGWLTFEQSLTGTGTNWLRNAYQQVIDVAPAKPMMMSEYASWEDTSVPGRKATWIREAHGAKLGQLFPAIKALLWFNMADSESGNTLYIESSPSAQAAYADTIGSERFTSNSYADAPAVPVKPAGPNVTVTLDPTADTYIDATAPGSAFGSATALRVEGTPSRTAFLKFDLTPLAGKVLTSARLQVSAQDGSAGRQTVNLVNQTDWSERYMTFNNTVPVSGTVLGAFAGIGAGETRSAPLDLLLLQPKVGGRLAVALQSSSDDELAVASREGGQPPKLVVTYSTP